MANEDGNEDRLTKNEFAELIQHLSVQEILSIEYRVGSDWSKLFSRKNIPTNVFVCNLCVLEASSFKNLLAHIDGRKHKLQMERVKQLYHPNYTYPKNDKNEGLEKSISKKSEDCTSSSTSIRPLVVGNNNQEKTQIIGNNKKCDTKLKASLEKNKNADKQNTVAIQLEKNKNADKLKKVVAQVDKNKNADKLNTVVIQDEILSMKTSAEIEKQNEVGEGDALSQNNKEDERATLNIYDKEEIDVIKDTKSRVNENTSNTKSNSIETKKSSTRIAVKRSLVDSNTEEEDVDLKRKIVVNPAAALSLKAGSMKSNENKNEESNKEPQYQTDKIIIPTVHKNKSHTNNISQPTTLQAHTNEPPKFSVKSYSSNPSENDNHGILGVEYVIKILKNRNDSSPRYECGLCELVLDGFAMQRHLEGYNHRLKFCEKHFPTAIRQYRQYMQNVPESEIFKVMAPVLAKLAIAIEQHHGRNLPYECYERDFSLNRHEILAKAFSCRHASEQYGPTFSHVVGSKEIDEFINNRHKYSPAPFSRTAIFDSKPGKSTSRHQSSRNTDKEFHSRDRHRHIFRESKKSDDIIHKSYMSSGLHEDMYPTSTGYQQTDNINHAQHVDDETYNLMVDDFLKGTLKGLPRKSAMRDNRKRSVSPDHNLSYGKRKSLSPLRQNDMWQAYRHMVDQEFYNLDERFKQYRKDPETHPSYNEEWQKFWKRRKDELVSSGIDHRKYNYQPEWVRFVKVRMEELYGQEVENIKIKSRERLCLPLSNEYISDEKYHVQAPKIKLTDEMVKTPCNIDTTIGLPTPSKLFHSPNTNSPQVVSVLRLMTALEDSLGSLGPKIIDLLSKALQTEKTNPLQVNAIILNDDNCSLIETAKEKIKGLIITGLFEGSKKKVLNQVVNDSEALLQYAYQFKQQLAFQRSSVESATKRTQNLPSLLFDSACTNVSSALQNQSGGSSVLIKKPSSATSSVTENLLTRVDKKELASKLAASLVAQGKTDFDPQQLQQLITVYKLIEKKKRENAGIVTSNKSGGSFQDSTSSNKKTLSDTLSDLLKSSSGASNVSNTSQSVQGPSNRIHGGTQFTSIVPSYDSSNSFTGVLQSSSENYFNNTAQSMGNAFPAIGGGRNQLEQQGGYGRNYTNHVSSNLQNPNMSNVYNNQYQYTNRMAQNWGWNSNTEMIQNYNMGRPDNFNQPSTWQKF